MQDIYNLALRFQDRDETVTLFLHQIVECAYFIRDYALHKSEGKLSKTCMMHS